MEDSNNFDVISVSHLFYPHVGGVEYTALNILKNMQSRGLRCVAVFCSEKEINTQYFGIRAIGVNAIRLFSGFYPLAGITFRRQLKELLMNNKTAKVIIHGRHFTTSVIAQNLCKKMGRSYIYIDTGFQPNIFRFGIFNKFIKFLDHRIFKKVISNASRIIAISKYTKSIITKSFPEFSSKVQIINNGFNEEVIKKYKISAKQKIVVFASRFSEIKDPKTTLDAYKHIADKHPDWKFYMIGEGDFEIDPDEHNLSENIFVQNKLLPQNELFDLLAKSSIYINSSVSEGLATAVLEAAGLGNLVVLSDAPSNVEIAEKLNLSEYIFKKKTPSDLAKNLEKAIFNTSASKNSINKSIAKKAKDHFSNEKVYDRYFRMIRD